MQAMDGYFSAIIPSQNQKLSIFKDLYWLIFSNFSPKELQNLVCVNKSWNQVIVLHTTADYSKKIVEYIGRLKIALDTSDNQIMQAAYAAAFDEINASIVTISKDPIACGNFKAFQRSAWFVRRKIIRVIIVLDQSDFSRIKKMRNKELFFLLGDIFRSCAFYPRYKEKEEAKLYRQNVFLQRFLRARNLSY